MNDESFNIMHDIDYKIMIDHITKRFELYTYIINPQTYEIVYLNFLMKHAFKDVKVGEKCYRALRNRDEVCEDCIAKTILEEKKGGLRRQLELGSLNIEVKADASVVKLSDGKDYVLINCYDLEKSEKSENLFVEADAFTRDAILYNALTNSTDDYIFMCDMQKNLFYLPETMVSEFDLPGQVIKDLISLWALKIHEKDRESFLNDINALATGESKIHNQEYRVRNKEGNWVWLRCRGYVDHKNGEPSFFAGIITNLGKKSKIDHLTGLLNKYTFERHVQNHLENVNKNFSVLLLGMDNLKHVNNLYGWDFGDEVMRISALKVQNLLPLNTGVYRLDGDVLGVIMPDAGVKDVEEQYGILNTVFSKYQEYEGHRYYCTISGGCCVIKKDEVISFYTLFKRCEYALEYSKKHGKNKLSFYSEVTMSEKDRFLVIINSLRESIENDFENFKLYFQPQVDADTCKIIGAEALLRWRCDAFGEVSPVEFIPLLEQTGLIMHVGKWVLENAAEMCIKWTKISPNFIMSVNISYLQLLDNEFISHLENLLKEKHLDPCTFHLEITESCIALEKNSLSNAFKEIRNIGFCIAMDDFGTGYSSLEILKNEPADVVKIDRAFVKDITKSDFDATFIRFVVALCHAVNIKVCLEGVETWEEYDLIKDMNLDIIQGYLFGRPQSVKDFETVFFK